MDVVREKDGTINMKQEHLIQRFMQLVEVTDEEHPKDSPALKQVLGKDEGGPERRHHWNYRQAVGMLNYMQGTTRPDISYAAHQCARFCDDPKLCHERAVRRIGKYLKGTAKLGLRFKPDATRGLECFVDADFAGGWDRTDVDNAENVLSRTGYVIMYAGCPVHWVSKLQTEIALSTAEAEYIALSTALREVLPTITLLKEVTQFMNILVETPLIHCKVYEDNNACISMAHGTKFSPRTKHIALKYHHFRAAIQNKTVRVLPIHTNEQVADIFTKALLGDKFTYLRRKLNGW